jgi:N-acetylmuramic acid 6-phosphate (MurNAc-6-P) etherase
MVDLMAVNKKLCERGARIISQVSGLNLNNSEALLVKADYSVKCAIVMDFLDCTLTEAKHQIIISDGFLSKILKLKK